MTDLLEIGLKKIPLYNDIGGVEIIDIMPRLLPKDRTAGYRVVTNARISYLGNNKSVKADNGLLRFLLKHKHMTPFESVVMTFKMKAPLFTIVQLLRHRTFSFNEASARYTKMPQESFFPDVRMQSLSNKQGSSDEKPSNEVIDLWLEAQDKVTEIWDLYNKLVDNGVAKEVARSILPVNMMKDIMVTGNLRNWLHFLHLRMDGHAQKEIRDLANGVYELIKIRAPKVIEAWEDFEYNAIVLTHPEQKNIKRQESTMSKRDMVEFDNKLADLNVEFVYPDNNSNKQQEQ